MSSEKIMPDSPYKDPQHVFSPSIRYTQMDPEFKPEQYSGISYFSVIGTSRQNRIGFYPFTTNLSENRIQSIIKDAAEPPLLKDYSFDLFIPVSTAELNEGLFELIKEYSDRTPPRRYVFEVVDPENLLGKDVVEQRETLRKIGINERQLSLAFTGLDMSLLAIPLLRPQYIKVKWYFRDAVGDHGWEIFMKTLSGPYGRLLGGPVIFEDADMVDDFGSYSEKGPKLIVDTSRKPSPSLEQLIVGS